MGHTAGHCSVLPSGQLGGNTEQHFQVLAVPHHIQCLVLRPALPSLYNALLTAVPVSYLHPLDRAALE